MAVERARTLGGMVAGASAAGVWAAQQPLDIRVFGVRYSDTELLGKLLTRKRWRPAGVLVHLALGSAVGGVYAQLAPRLPGPAWVRGVSFAMVEHLAGWPGTRRIDALHPAASDFPPLWGDHRAFAQATWRHVLYGALLGTWERRLAHGVTAG